MAGEIAELGLKVTTDGVTEATKELSQLEAEAKKVAEGADKLATSSNKAATGIDNLGDEATEARGKQESLTGAVVRGNIAFSLITQAMDAVVKTVQMSITSWAQYELVIAKMTQSFGQVGNATGFTIERLQEFAGELESTTGVSEESILKIQTVINRFGRVTGERFKEVTELAIDMAAAMGTEPVQAAELLARAMNDPARGIEQLRRAFEGIDPVMANAIQRLADTGDAASAMDKIVDLLQAKVGGSGTAQNDTLVGAWGRFIDAMGDGLREMGKTIDETIGLKGWLDSLAVAINTSTDAAKKNAGDINYLSVIYHDLAGAVAYATGNIAEFNRQEGMRQKALTGSTSEQKAHVQTWRDLKASVEGAFYSVKNYGEQQLRNAKATGQSILDQKDLESQVRKGADAVARLGREEAAVKRARDAYKDQGAVFTAADEARVRAGVRTISELEASHAKAARSAGAHATAETQAAKATESALKGVRDYVRDLQRHAEAAKLSDEEQARLNAEFRITDALMAEGVTVTQELIDEYVHLAKAAVDLGIANEKAADQAKKALDDQKRATEDLIQTFTGFFEGIVDGSENAGEALQKLIIKLIEMQIQFEIMQSLGLSGGTDIFGIIGSIFGGIGGGGGGVDPVTGAARGEVFSRGNVIPFASGGMVGRPMLRDMALMGEQGSEAVLPLKRDGQGNLGVSGSGSDETKVIVQNIDQRKNGAPLETQTSRGQDGQLMIRTFIRDEVKRSLADGSMDKDMGRNYGLNRNPVKRS